MVDAEPDSPRQDPAASRAPERIPERGRDSATQTDQRGDRDAVRSILARLDRPVVLVGLMGAGKSCIGKRLASHLGLPFVDADREIEIAAGGCTIPEIFAMHGEAAFRDGERRVIQRLLGNPVHILATGGGAFVDPNTRALVKERGLSIWIRADLDLLVKRVSRRNNRPLLQNVDPRTKLAELMTLRDPFYAEADIIVDSADGPPEVTLGRVLEALEAHLLRKSGEKP
ncbi:shikimate kinase [Dongia mobilis]|uniref:Shikimate kinase n=1 Tax=Dongia mobilis TaxID=578943 RepID=A0A4R6WYK9_9PROT|nr:shikimate kinase [Dongia mobilis]TDQ84533.1 shikimate kinase [Dongia mobilis]